MIRATDMEKLTFIPAAVTRAGPGDHNRTTSSAKSKDLSVL